MKILHTSDLHIGKRLHQIDLIDDQSAFFIWLIRFIKKELVDALIISGDIFDVANPSSEARKLYFEFLVELSRLNCKVILTGGNHDSPAVLEAPKEVLKALNILVVGAKKSDLKDEVFPIQDKDGKTALVVAAVPYLRDRDLRRMLEDESYDDRLEAIKQGILATYRASAEYCENNYPGIPAIAMGHLYLANAKVSESEREIQIGNLAGLDASLLPDYFQYYALGHLHKAQDLDPEGKIRYSGAPYPLSFGEKDYTHRVVLLTLSDGKLISKSIDVPKNRKLLKFSGTLEEVRNQLDNFNYGDGTLKSLIEVEVVEENEDPNIHLELDFAIDAFQNDHALIVKRRIQFTNRTKGTHELYDDNESIEDLSPKDVFERRIASDELPEKSKKLLLEAFGEILEMVYQSDNTVEK